MQNLVSFINNKLGVNLVTSFMGDIVCIQYSEKQVKELFIDDLIMFDLEGRSLLSLNAIKIIRELKQEFKSGK